MSNGAFRFDDRVHPKSKRLLMSFLSSPRAMLILFVTFLISVPLGLFAQSTSIKGRVTDSDGAPLQSVSVTLKGSNAATTTKEDGTFTLPVTRRGNDVLEFSFIGYTTKEVSLGNSDELTVQLVKK